MRLAVQISTPILSMILCGCSAGNLPEDQSEEEATIDLSDAQEIQKCASAYKIALMREYDGSGMSEVHLNTLAEADCTSMTPEERVQYLAGGDVSSAPSSQATSAASGPSEPSVKDRIAAAIRSAGLTQVEVAVQDDGIVILSGFVPNEDEAVRAGRIAMSNGARDVLNRFTIGNPAERDIPPPPPTAELDIPPPPPQ